ncbi:MAG TPA: NPCBM/NEW2 domain-containing protein, partial [Planctomycetota bacterium]|nr:NPCBM/NEW2 domain-containing protein [Planctomycetota bacterium]
PVLDKPAGLLYRNDVLRLAITSMWLWGKPVKASYGASLLDIAGKEWPVCSGSIDLAPGATVWIDGKLQNIPLGSYRLKTTLQYLDVTESHTEADHGYLVYEPGGKPLPYNELAAFLGDRLGVLADLGFRRDMMVVPWHSTQGTMSVEMTMGHFYFNWLDPEVEARRKAGMEVIGKLGMTPEWADPSVNYLTISNAWAGNTTVMPAQTIWWEEYVHRTVLNFADRIKSWVVWERPDAPGFATNTQEYVEKMLSVAHRAAKEADPNAVVVSGGVSRENMESFLNDLIEAGAGRYIDAMGILPTTAPLAPEDGYMDVMLSRAERLRTQEQFTPPLWVLDLGWPTGTGDGSVSEDNQARYLARAWAICRAFGARRVMIEPHQMFIDGKGLSPAGMRDSADLFFQEGRLWGVKPAALAGRTARDMLEDGSFIREIFLVDRWDGLSRAYLFRRPDGKLVLSAWRRHDTARLRLPDSAEQVLDVFGNTVAVQKQDGLTLNAAPHYVLFGATDPAALARQLERTPLDYVDASESAWKRTWTFFLDVGSEPDEKAAQYSSTKSRLVQNVDSFYHNDYGRHVVDSGRQFTGDEKFVVDVSSFGQADMIIRKRINYSVPNQRVKVYCNDQLVGQWFAFKRDRRFRWRNTEFIVPNRFFAGKPAAALRFEAQDCEATSYAYWIGPLRQKTVYASDLSLLVNNSGYGAGANFDKNILGGPIRFHKDETRDYAKGLGTNAAAAFEDSLIVIPLNKQFKRFRATVGIDAATDGRGTVRFRIGDGRKMLFDSADMTFYSDPKDVDIDVSDVILLMLSVGDCGDGNKNDIANWADARLELK